MIRFINEMMNKFNIRLIFFLFVLFSNGTNAQTIIKALPRWVVGGHFHIQIPDHPIDEYLTKSSLGFLFEAQYRVMYNQPFLAGAYYHESTLSRYTLKYVQSSGTGDIDIKEKANTRRLEAGITAGFYPEINWLLQPYLQGRVGLAIFQTSSILIDRDTHESIERISEHTSLVPGYGLDIGIHIVPNIWYIRGDVRVGILGNTSIDYLVLDEENKGSTGYPIDYFVLRESAGRWWKVSVGLSYLF